ncbi:MAG: GTPase ObgE [Humidesulfovibrio sp.]|uniref:GTPase ObgE n=1 Tax=Humidesulfovibrio sp. TaxID=2910988 RepID=UPI0027EE32D7|nr:GTPase ObgE [Humidesulfovibrio sp.]MDQ7834716.1 GTPase ObgE [Humidesulfovibrio sp.]
MRFVDEASIIVRSGKGGNGSASLKRAKNLPKGGPDGGDGGKGGDVIFRASNRLLTLYDFRVRSMFEAENGVNGKGQDKYGRNGEDLVIEVPVGTMLWDMTEDEDEPVLLADLARADQEFVVCPGGIGGRGNLHFKTSTNRAPKYAEPGKPATEKRLMLRLKVLADAGLLGLPNAGKSTFLSAVSAARPKIAAYPFTTLVPNLGVVEDQNSRRLVIADIPGLIEGASQGAGLGYQFLKHVERTRFLVHILSGEDADPENPEAGYAMLNEELRAFDADLAAKPQIRVINKIDVLDPERLAALRKNAPGDILFVSALTGEGLDKLLAEMWARFDALSPAAELNEDGSEIEAPDWAGES